jgi:MFS family permease
MFAPLQHPSFRLLWLATLVSNLGGMLQAVAAGWVMTTLTDSPQMVALVQAATTLPIMLLSIGSGALADSFDRRRVMMAAQAAMLGASAVLSALAYLGLTTPWSLLALTFLVGSGTALHNPSWQASVGDLVPRQEIAGAVTLNGMGFNLMRSVGPAVGGLVVAVAGAAVAFALNALSYLPVIAALARWQPNYPRATLPRERFPSAVAAGLRYASMSPNLLTVIARSFLFGLSAISMLALLPIVAIDLLSGGPLTYGGLFGAFGAGGICGAAMNASLRARLGNEAITRSAFIVFALSTVLLAMSDSIALSHLLIVPAGASWVVTNSLFNAVVQLSTPRWVVGRMMSIYQTATFGGMAVGSWIWGSVAAEYGAGTALVAAGFVLALCALIGLRFAMPEFGSLDLSPLDQFREPSLKLDLRARSGPIMVMIDYVIDQDDVPEFLAAMTLRRRMRIRDGARQWTLLRDLENPEMWTESYHVPTWVEYVRHNQRRTRADSDVAETLRKLHRMQEPPRVHRMIERQTVSPSDDLPLKPHTDIHG